MKVKLYMALALHRDLSKSFAANASVTSFEADKLDEDAYRISHANLSTTQRLVADFVVTDNRIFTKKQLKILGICESYDLAVKRGIELCDKGIQLAIKRRPNDDDSGETTKWMNTCRWWLSAKDQFQDLLRKFEEATEKKEKETHEPASNG